VPSFGAVSIGCHVVMLPPRELHGRRPLVLRTGVRAGALRRREGKGSAVVT
jgi:hypothetical protein